jgi:hypothetical protein
VSRRAGEGVLLLAVLLTASCREAGEQAAPAGAPAPAPLLESVESAEFEPPADGRLTAGQVERYLAVRERGRELREAGGPDARTTAELRAAVGLGVNPKEYRWGEERVREARLARAARAMEERLEAGRRRHLERLERDLEAAKTGGEREEARRRIDAFRRNVERSRVPAGPAEGHNAALLERYADRLEQEAGPTGKGDEP